MNTGGDVADQMVKFYLEGFEVLAKVTGKGAEHTIALLLNIMKDKSQTKGKARLNTMLKSGKPLNIFTINRKDLKKFASEAKRYGVLYSALIDKFDKTQDGMNTTLVSTAIFAAIYFTKVFFSSVNRLFMLVFRKVC